VVTFSRDLISWRAVLTLQYAALLLNICFFIMTRVATIAWFCTRFVGYSSEYPSSTQIKPSLMLHWKKKTAQWRTAFMQIYEIFPFRFFHYDSAYCTIWNAFATLEFATLQNCPLLRPTSRKKTKVTAWTRQPEV